MPTEYKIKTNAKFKAEWSQETFIEALQRIKAGEIGKREAERYYGISTRTLGRRFETNTICPKCKKWLHETCILYNTMCNECGRKKKEC